MLYYLTVLVFWVLLVWLLLIIFSTISNESNESIEENMIAVELEKDLEWLSSLGCYPSIYKRGNLWRAHVNMAGNYWAERETPALALSAAIILWETNGKQMDGYANSGKDI